MEIPEIYFVVTSYLTNRITASVVQFRAGGTIPYTLLLKLFYTHAIIRK